MSGDGGTQARRQNDSTHKERHRQGERERAMRRNRERLLSEGMEEHKDKITRG